jgi:glutamate dehydrogenase
MGSVFAFRMQDETSADVASVARAFTIAREVFEIRDIWEAIEALDNKVDTSVQHSMLRTTQGLLKQAARWLLDRVDEVPDIAAAVSRLNPGAIVLMRCLPDVLTGSRLQRYEDSAELYTGNGVPPALARRIAALTPLHAGLDIISVARTADVDVRYAAEAYFGIGHELDLDWILDQVDRLRVEGLWQAKARGSLRDNLYGLQHTLAVKVVTEGTRPHSATTAVQDWIGARQFRADHMRQTLAEMRTSGPLDFATASVALQEIRRLAQG